MSTLVNSVVSRDTLLQALRIKTNACTAVIESPTIPHSGHSASDGIHPAGFSGAYFLLR